MAHAEGALPETMRVLGQRRDGGVEVLEELRLLVPQAEGADLLVRMQAMGLNPLDTKVRSNWVGFGDFQAGDPVMFAGSVARAGCQREFALVDSRLVGRRPANLRPAEAVIEHNGDQGAQLQALGIHQLQAVLHTSEPDDTIERLLALLAPFGRMVCLLPINRPLETAPLFARSLRLQYELMVTRPLFGVDLAHQGRILDQIADLVEGGRLCSTLSRELPWTLESLREGHRQLESRRTLGKIVLTLAG